MFDSTCYCVCECGWVCVCVCVLVWVWVGVSVCVWGGGSERDGGRVQSSWAVVRRVGGWVGEQVVAPHPPWASSPPSAHLRASLRVLAEANTTSTACVGNLRLTSPHSFTSLEKRMLSISTSLRSQSTMRCVVLVGWG